MGPDPTEAVLALYPQIEAAAQTGSPDALVEAVEALLPLYDELTVQENILGLQAEVLADPLPGTFADPATTTAAAKDYQDAAQTIALHRLALLRLMYARALGPEPTVETNLQAVLATLRRAETELASKARAVTALLAGVALPDVPAMVLISAPLAAETGREITISVTLANLGLGASAAGRVTLVTPPELTSDLLTPATQSFVTTGGLARVDWKLRPARAGTYIEDYAIQLYDGQGRPLDVHQLLLGVDEAGAERTLDPHQEGTLTTALGSASLAVPAGAFAGAGGPIGPHGAGDVDLHLLAVSTGATLPGFVPVGNRACLVAAYQSETTSPAALVGARPTLTLRWDDAVRPSYIPARELRILMAETAERWVPLESIVDTVAGTVRAAIPQTGWFTLGWADAQPPAAPAGLTAEADDAGVRLQWQTVTEPDVAGYQVLARPDPAAPVEVVYAVAQPGPGQFDVPDHAAGATRHYTVRALDAAGNPSAESAPVVASRPGGSAPGTLLVQWQGSEIVFSWPAEAADFTLESTPSLRGVTWTPFPGSPGLVNGRLTVTAPAAEVSRFFRLRRP
jgi:hypothetical protein